MKKDRFAGLKSYGLPAMLLMSMVLIMSCSNNNKQPAEQNRLSYIGKHFGSHFEEFTGRLLSLPEDNREAVVMEFLTVPSGNTSDRRGQRCQYLLVWKGKNRRSEQRLPSWLDCARYIGRHRLQWKIVFLQNLFASKICPH